MVEGKTVIALLFSGLSLRKRTDRIGPGFPILASSLWKLDLYPGQKDTTSNFLFCSPSLSSFSNWKNGKWLKMYLLSTCMYPCRALCQHESTEWGHSCFFFSYYSRNRWKNRQVLRPTLNLSSSPILGRGCVWKLARPPPLFYLHCTIHSRVKGPTLWLANFSKSQQKWPFSSFIALHESYYLLKFYAILDWRFQWNLAFLVEKKSVPGLVFRFIVFSVWLELISQRIRKEHLRLAANSPTRKTFFFKRETLAETTVSSN